MMPRRALLDLHGGLHPHGGAPPSLSGACMMQTILPNNWLRVLDTTERPQIDQGICHQLHPIVSLLDACKSKQQSLELVFPRKGPLDMHA